MNNTEKLICVILNNGFVATINSEIIDSDERNEWSD